MALVFPDFLEPLAPFWNIIQVLLFILVTGIVFSVLLQIIKRRLLKKVRTKKQASNVMTFLDLLTFVFVFFLLLVALASYYGNLGDIGFIAGLLTVAIGWALQKPISGVVAWLIIITRHPFLIGDRIAISKIIGDVSNITLSHIHLDEIGGTIEGEESSNRTIMIPNSVIFEQNIINYNNKDDYILDEVSTAITYESNLEHAEKLIIAAVDIIMEPHWKRFPKRVLKKPYTRIMFKDSGIEVTVRYMSIATARNEISTDIRREIYNHIRDTPHIEFAYPHTEVLVRKKSSSVERWLDTIKD